MAEGGRHWGIRDEETKGQILQIKIRTGQAFE
jgi:hypothetical protein